MVPIISIVIAKCTIASFTSTKWRVKVTTLLVVWIWKMRFTINKSKFILFVT